MSVFLYTYMHVNGFPAVTRSALWPRRELKHFMLNSAEHEIFLLINVCILTFMSRKNSIICLPEPEKNLIFLIVFILMGVKNFMFSRIGPNKRFYNLGARLFADDAQIYQTIKKCHFPQGDLQDADSNGSSFFNIIKCGAMHYGWTNYNMRAKWIQKH